MGSDQVERRYRNGAFLYESIDLSAPNVISGTCDPLSRYTRNKDAVSKPDRVIWLGAEPLADAINNCGHNFYPLFGSMDKSVVSRTFAGVEQHTWGRMCVYQLQS